LISGARGGKLPASPVDDWQRLSEQVRCLRARPPSIERLHPDSARGLADHPFPQDLPATGRRRCAGALALGVGGDRQGVVDLHTLDRMVGGWVRATWVRLRRWVESERIEDRSPNVGEWWQWLYEQLEADPDPGKASGTHVAYRGRRRR
jgi:hypothetical protein